jgi:hypothetical protein
MPAPALTPYEQRRDALARILAALLMELRDDPTGADLPQECWWPTRAKAAAILFLISKGEEHEAARRDLGLEWRV